MKPNAARPLAHNLTSLLGAPMRTTSRIAVAFLAFLGTSSTAAAGGLGLIYQAGLHQERAYSYKGKQQAIDIQSKPNSGPGLEALIGDQNDKIQGLLRMSWVAETQASPSIDDKGKETCKPENNSCPDYSNLQPRQIGVLGLGLQWGVLGDPSDKQIVVNTMIGSGFITTDNTEFVIIELGAGGTLNFTENLQAVANLSGHVRARKHFSYGPTMHMGLRYLFD
jgi:hypothetical protein